MAHPEPVGGETDLDRPETEAASRNAVWGTTRKVVVGVVGGTVTVAGLISMPLPVVPGTPILLAGLAILSIEFESVRKRTDRLRDRVRQAIADRR